MSMRIRKRIWSGVLLLTVLLFGFPMIASAAAPVSKISITLKEPMVGGLVDTKPAVPKGAKYTITDFRWFESDTGEESEEDWTATEKIRDGKYYGIQCVVQVNEGYEFASPVQAEINGAEAKVTKGAVPGCLIVQKVYEPLRAPLEFKAKDSFDIPEDEGGTKVEAFSVADAVSGGTSPYQFDLIDGPSWLSVSPDGTVTGTRPKKGCVEATATIRVTDQTNQTAKIEIHVGHVQAVEEAAAEESESEKEPAEKASSGIGTPMLLAALALGVVGVMLVVVLVVRKRSHGRRR